LRTVIGPEDGGTVQKSRIDRVFSILLVAAQHPAAVHEHQARLPVARARRPYRKSDLARAMVIVDERGSLGLGGPVSIYK
jgi:hypothetical protein